MKSDIRRKECIVCNAPLMGDVVHIGDQYPSAIYPKADEDYKSAIRASSLNLTKCFNHDCGLVQLAHEYNLDYVLEHYPFLSGGTATMNEILSDITKEVEDIASLSKDDVVLDIGGNDGTLLSLLSRNVRHRINMDAAHGIMSVLNDPDYLRVQGKFSSKAYLELDIPFPKVIFCVAMFYHLDNPLSFCKEVREIMNDDTIWCIQMTHLGSMLESNIYDNIVHEHVAHYSLKSLEFLMNKIGLEICDAKIADSYGGSLRVFVMKGKDKFPKKYYRKNYATVQRFESEKETNTPEALIRFDERVKLLTGVTKELIAHIVDRRGKMLAFGASTKGNMMCQLMGLNHDLIECVLDNSKKKIGLLMAGSDIPIVNEKDYLPKLPEYLLILPYYYLGFFKSFIEKYLKPKQHVYLLVPLPKPYFVKLSGQ